MEEKKRGRRNSLMMMVVIERTLFERRLTGENYGFRKTETVLYEGDAMLDRDKVPEI